MFGEKFAYISLQFEFNNGFEWRAERMKTQAPGKFDNCISLVRCWEVENSFLDLATPQEEKKAV